MEWLIPSLIALPFVFAYLAVLWVVVLVVYNFIFESFDFGPLGMFAIKSLILLGFISVIYVLPYVHWLSLIFWWLGLMVIFQKDFWECRVLVMLIWGLSFIFRLLLSDVFFRSSSS